MAQTVRSGLWRRWVAMAAALACAASAALVAAPAGAAEKRASAKKPVAQKTTAAPKKKATTAKAPARAGSAQAKRQVSARSKANTRVKATIPAARKGATAKARPVVVVDRPTVGEKLGLAAVADPLDLSSNVALVVDQSTNEILFSKNDHAVLPIASLTKLMTGLVIADAHLDMNEPITITHDDIDTLKGSRSRLAVGTTLSRGEMMHLALMSSENRAASALGRTFPGGMREFVRLMNEKAAELGMRDTRYVEPTGLSSDNRSSARDLATLVQAAYERPILRTLSTSPGHEVEIGHRTLQYNNSNRLVKSPEWDIGLQKTGYISEAGRCLVMQARIAGRQLILVFLDAAGKISRLQDAERVRRWVELNVEPRAPVARPQG